MSTAITIEPTKYVRKPLYVDAIRVTRDNIVAAAEWCQGELAGVETQDTNLRGLHIRVRVHNPMNVRQTKAFIGDWILYTERGYKVYTNRAFNACFNQIATSQISLPEISEEDARDVARKMGLGGYFVADEFHDFWAAMPKTAQDKILADIYADREIDSLNHLGGES